MLQSFENFVVFVLPLIEFLLSHRLITGVYFLSPMFLWEHFDALLLMHLSSTLHGCLTVFACFMAVSLLVVAVFWQSAKPLAARRKLTAFARFTTSLLAARCAIDAVLLLTPFVIHQMLIMLAWTFFSEQRAKRNFLMRLAMASVYMWSGLSKTIDPEFHRVDFFLHVLSRKGDEALRKLSPSLERMVFANDHGVRASWIAPATEFVVGGVLLFHAFAIERQQRQQRKHNGGLWTLVEQITRVASVLFIVVMHCDILVELGPYGQNWNRVVWPWNLYAALITVLMFYVNVDDDGIVSRAFADKKNDVRTVFHVDDADDTESLFVSSERHRGQQNDAMTLVAVAVVSAAVWLLFVIASIVHDFRTGATLALSTLSLAVVTWLLLKHGRRILTSMFYVAFLSKFVCESVNA
jgi:hypothetical protein